jgi:transcriptional regulator with XRE-family HTH domain
MARASRGASVRDNEERALAMIVERLAATPGLDPSLVLRAAVRGLRQARGISQRDLAASLHLSAHSSIVDYEAGRRIPHDDILSGYERNFGLHPGQLQQLRRRVLAHRAAADLAAAVDADIATGARDRSAGVDKARVRPDTAA